MTSTSYHQANMLQTQVLTEIRDVKSSMDHTLSQINTSQTTAPPNPDQMCILTTRQDNIVSMMKLIHSLQEQVKELAEQNTGVSTPKTANTTRIPRTNISKYC